MTFLDGDLNPGFFNKFLPKIWGRLDLSSPGFLELLDFIHGLKFQLEGDHWPLFFFLIFHSRAMKFLNPNDIDTDTKKGAHLDIYLPCSVCVMPRLIWDCGSLRRLHGNLWGISSRPWPKPTMCMAGQKALLLCHYGQFCGISSKIYE